MPVEALQWTGRVNLHYAAEPVGSIIRQHNHIGVMFPGALCEIRSPRIAVRLWSIWCESSLWADRIFAPPFEPRRRYTDTTHVYSRIAWADHKLETSVAARPAASSPLGVGQITVRMGILTMVCDSEPAWQGLHHIWQTAYEASRTLWPGSTPPLAALEEKVRKKAKLR